MEWIKTYESEWLFIVLVTELLVSSFTAYWVWKEYRYDEAKDLRRKTRTTKKTTKTPDGNITEEESCEVEEPNPKEEGREK